jgi:1-pyrroline-5-carboxylate dehydrogenase
VATRLTYTSGASTPEVDAEFESELERVRSAASGPFPHVVGGETRSAGPELVRADPSTGRPVSRAHRAPAAVVEEAVAAARAAQPGWRGLGYEERCRLLRAAAERIRERRVELAAVVSAEVGKVRTEAIAEVEEAVDLIEAYCAQIEEHAGFEVPLGRLSADEDNRSVLRPYGVFGVIGPFNFPAALCTGMAAGALVAGNTVVLKPPEEAPWTGALLGDALEVLPAGVANVVHGGPETGRDLVESGVDGIAFTGSAEVGRAIVRRLQEGPYGRPALVEMGGKNPVIVTAAADLDAAAEGIARSTFGFSGQKCSACSRAVVVGDVHDELVDLLAARAGAYRVGDPADREAETGPVVNEEAVARFERAVAEAARDGRVVAGGRRLEGRGLYVAPTVVTGLPRGHRLTRDELFLPFLTVTPVDTLDEALAEANAVDYGLTAGIFSRDEDEVARFLDGIEAGVVYVNRRAGATTGAWPGIQSFPGWKSSGATGKGGLGPYYVQQFMREQSQTVVRVD